MRDLPTSDVRPARPYVVEHRRARARDAAASPDHSSPERHPLLSSSLPAIAPAHTPAGTPTAPTFAQLGVPASLVHALDAQGITEPFPIQAATLPDALNGRDVLGRGRTGSGKTLAFALPMVAALIGARAKANRPRALVLAPTRELANQIAATVHTLAEPVGLRVMTIYGGVSQRTQVAQLDRGVDIVIATPGRLEDLLRQKALTLDAVSVAVLDEADHMADLGFLPGVRRILALTPARGQRLLFSATLDRGVDQIVRQFLHDPLRHSVDSATSSSVEMRHHVFTVNDVAAKREVVHLLASGTGRRVLFMRTKHQAKKLARQLTLAGIPAVDLHGNLSQPQRERNLAAFSGGSARVLVATDIAARGIHVDDIELVVHVDPPAEAKSFLHRSGRTARAGSAGDVVTLVLPEQLAEVRSLTRAAKITATPTPVRVDTPHLLHLVGEVAPMVAPAPAAAKTPGGRPRKSTGRSAPGRPATTRTAAARTSSAVEVSMRGKSTRRRGR